MLTVLSSTATALVNRSCKFRALDLKEKNRDEAAAVAATDVQKTADAEAAPADLAM